MSVDLNGLILKPMKINNMRVLIKHITPEEHKKGLLIIQFKVTEPIKSHHFKQLVRLAKRFNPHTKGGYILESDTISFNRLIERIELATDEECLQSYNESLQRAIKRHL